MRSVDQTTGPDVADVDALIAKFSDAARATLRASEAGSLSELLPHIYQELRQLAAGYLRRERSDHTLPPIALVHEA